MNKRYNILLIAYACEPDKGSESAVGWNWATQLANLNDISVVTRSNNKENIDMYLNENDDMKNVIFLYFDIPILAKFKKRIIFGTQIYYQLWHYFINMKLNTDEYDIVHHVSLMSLKQSYPILYRNKSVIGPVGGLETLDKSLVKKSKNKVYEYLRIHNLKRFIRSKRFKNLAQIDVLILANTTMIDEIKRINPNTKVFQVGVNFKPELRQSKKERIIYWGGISMWWKGFEIFLEAINMIELKKYNFRVVITGNLDKYRKKIQNNRNFGQIKYYGFISKYEQEKLLAKSMILCFTSLHETTGLMLLEAMAYGTVPIVIDTGGPADIVTSQTGIKVPIVKDYKTLIEDYKNAIISFLENEQNIFEMAELCQTRIDDNYTWSKVADSTQILYKKMLEK